MEALSRDFRATVARQGESTDSLPGLRSAQSEGRTLSWFMATKLSTQQVNQLAFLDLLPPKIARAQNVIEQMAGGSADESIVRGMVRIMDEMKAGASQLKLNSLADAAGNMAAIGRRGGGQQVKVRAL